MNNVGDTDIIHDGCGTGPEVNVEYWSGVVDVVVDNDNGSPSPGGDDGFKVGQINNIEPCDVAAVENIGRGHAINNNHRDVAVVNNVGNPEFINNSCDTGPDINVGNQMGVVDIVAALNSKPHNVAILQQQRTSLKQPEIAGNTNINNENHHCVGDDSVDNATRQEVGVGHMQLREIPHTGPQITIRTGTGKVAGCNKLGSEDCTGVASVPTITYLRKQLALRDAIFLLWNR
jgi:hypothetical protein